MIGRCPVADGMAWPRPAGRSSRVFGRIDGNDGAGAGSLRHRLDGSDRATQLSKVTDAGAVASRVDNFRRLARLARRAELALRPVMSFG